MYRMWLIIFIVILAISTDCFADDFDYDEKANHKFSITSDYFLGYMVSESGDIIDEVKMSASYELGVLRYFGANDGLGATIQFTVDPIDSRLTFRARYRRLFSKNISVDLSPSLLITHLAGSNNSSKPRRIYPSYNLYTQLNIGKSFGIRFTWDKYEYTMNPYRWFEVNPKLSYLERSEFHLGIVTRGKASLVALGVTGVLAVTFAVVSHLIGPRDQTFF